MGYARFIVEGMAVAIWEAASIKADQDPGDGHVPEAAEIAARELANLFTTLNDASLDKLFTEDGVDLEVCADCEQSTGIGSPSPHVCWESFAISDEDAMVEAAFTFGYDLAQLAMGMEVDRFSGISSRSFISPTFEVSIDGDTLNWTGGAKEHLYSTNPGSVMTGPGWDAARQKLRSAARGGRKNPASRFEDERPLVMGERVHITDPDDDTNIIHEGVVMRPPSRGWVAIEIDGEQRIDEWPLERVWRQNPGAIDDLVADITPNPVKVRLFDHPPERYDRSGSRVTDRYKILPGPKHGPTPRVQKTVAKKAKRNPVTTCAGCGTPTHASELDDRELCARCATKTGLPHLREGAADIRFAFVCRHCKRGLAELLTQPGHFIDSTSLTETCPSNGRGGHEPYGR